MSCNICLFSLFVNLLIFNKIPPPYPKFREGYLLYPYCAKLLIISNNSSCKYNNSFPKIQKMVAAEIIFNS